MQGFSNSFWPALLANVVAGLIVLLIPIVLFDEKKVVRPFIAKIPNTMLAKFLVGLLYLKSFLYSKYARLGYIFVFLILINVSSFSATQTLFFSILMFIVSLSFLLPERYEKLKSPSSIFSEFTKLDNWKVITGEPKVEENFGNPKPPDILLTKRADQATNTFLVLKDFELERGIIELDYYLEPEGLLNIVFFANLDEQNWYMARYDSRQSETDSILIKDRGAAANWRHDQVGYSGGSKVHSWYHARLEFSSEKVKMYRDDELLVELQSPRMFGKQIGIFNEVNEAHIANLRVSK